MIRGSRHERSGRVGRRRGGYGACGCDSSAKLQSVPRGTLRSAGEFAEEVGFVHAVLEGFAAVDEDYGDFIGELAAELFVAVDVDILPGETATAVQFGESLFDDLAEVASLAGVDHDLSGLGHWGEFSKGGRGFPVGSAARRGPGVDVLRARSFADFRPLRMTTWVEVQS